ncbi:MAG: hypothetical protein KAQ98_05500 [Bacteriovoracaceae bacterium]|nr:hypothetical protein [Bacteriovoracaceae bacterium]
MKKEKEEKKEKYVKPQIKVVPLKLQELMFVAACRDGIAASPIGPDDNACNRAGVHASCRTQTPS